MVAVEDLLASSFAFRGAPIELLRRSASLWSRRELSPAKELWTEGQGANELAVLVSGELVVRVGEDEVGRVRAGEMVGEASAFFHEPRMATVEANMHSTLLILPNQGLASLRAFHPAMYDLLLDHALVALAQR